MSTQDKLLELAEEAVETIKKLIKRTEEENPLVNVNFNECGDTIVFTLKNNRTVEYSLSEIGYVFEDDLDGLEIFSVKRFKEFYIKLKNIQSQTELL